MKKYLLLSFLMAACFLVNAQKKISYQAQYLDYDEEVLPGAQRLIGNVVFRHENTVGYCDSAYLYEQDNRLVAFGKRVRIYAGDSVTLYGNIVYYNGDTRVSSIARNVELHHGTAVLYTDSLVYDLKNDRGYYLTGGTMMNNADTVTSLIGDYFTQTDRLYLDKDVLLRSESYVMDCDSLLYDTRNKVVFFVSRTHLVSDDNVIYTSSGWYDTHNDLALLTQDVEVHGNPQTITGDSLYYDRYNRYGIGWNNVVMTDSSNGYVVKGNYAEYYETGGFSTVTDSAQLILIDGRDSLFLHADTLRVLVDSAQNPQLFLAYFHTKFFRDDIQGVCDSMAYNVEDSLLYMFYNPVLWSGENQLSADTVCFTLIDSSNMKIVMSKAGFIISSVYDEKEFNQIKGMNITGYVRNKQLYQVDVVNNAECIYYLQEEDSAQIGINTSATSDMRILLVNNEVDQITYYNDPDGKIYSEETLLPSDRLLKDFRWLKAYRPQSMKDIYHTPIPRVKGGEIGVAKPEDTNPKR